ncbi:MAG: hypothetical protein AB7U85_06035 [Alphaproteobacteria bacterium]
MTDIFFDISNLNTIKAWFNTVLALPNTSSAFSAKYGSIKGDKINDFISTIDSIHKISNDFIIQNDVEITTLSQEELLQHNLCSGSLFDVWFDFANVTLNAANYFAKALSEFENIKTADEAKNRLHNLAKVMSAMRVKAIETKEYNAGKLLIIQPLLRHLSNHPVADITAQESGKIQSQIEIIIKKEAKSFWQTKKSKQANKDEIVSKQAEIELYNELLSDAASVFDDGRVVTSFIKLNNTADSLWRMFDNAFNLFNLIITSSTEEQLASYVWLSEALDITQNTVNWNNVSLSAQQFIEDMRK